MNRYTRVTVTIDNYGPVGTQGFSQRVTQTFEGNPVDVPNMTGHVVELAKRAKRMTTDAMDECIQKHGSLGTPLTVNDIVVKAAGQ